MTPFSLRLAVLVCLSLIGIVVEGQGVIAQIIPDNSLGAESSRTRPDTIKNTPSDVLEGGARRGNNLFHSFREFNIQEGRGAYFANPETIRNIFTRVTGGNISQILGTLGVLGNANLFLINPNGIIFGPNARLDIRGAFVGSTANSLVFDNNFEFSASNPDAPPLLTVNMPIGLRFRQGAGDITSTANLSTPSNLTLQGNNLNISGTVAAGGDLNLEALNTLTIRDSITRPFFAAAGGDLRLQGNQSIDIFVLNNPRSGLFSGGDMILRSTNRVGGDAHYYSGGSFRIEKLDGSLGDLYSPNDPVIRTVGDVFIGAYQGASLHIIAGGSVTIPGFILITGADPQFGLQETITLSNGQQIQIDGKNNPTVDIRAGVREEAIGIPSFQGSGFDIFFPPISLSQIPVSADINLGTIFFSRNPFDINQKITGDVLLTNQYQPNPNLRGNITFNPSHPFFGSTAINTSSLTSGGRVTMDSRENISIRGNTNSFAFGQFGRGGEVLLNSTNNVSIVNARIDVASSQDGNITINARNDINITNSLLFAGIRQGLGFENAQAGDIRLNSTNNIVADASLIANGVLRNAIGNAGDTDISASNFILNNGANITTNTLGKGDAGNIEINVRDSVAIKGESFLLGPGGIFSQVQATGEGDSGRITINTNILTLENGANIDSSTFGQGDTGTIQITARNNVNIIGESSLIQGLQSGIVSQVLDNATGNSGGIIIDTPTLTLKDGGRIDASTLTSRNGNAGTIQILNADKITLTGESSFGKVSTISSQVQTGITGEGNSGGIVIETYTLNLERGGGIYASTLGKGNAGTIQINATDSINITGEAQRGDRLVSGIFSAVNEAGEEKGRGSSGGIIIETLSLNIQNGGSISASTFSLGNAGEIKIQNTDKITISGESFRGFASNISSQVQDNATGNSGGIIVDTSTLILENGGFIDASTEARGNSGAVQITADEINLRGKSSQGLGSAIGSTVEATAQGNSQGITINSARLNLQDGGFISSRSASSGNAGNILINATESVSISGISFSSAENRNLGGIEAFTSNTGNAGSITINTPSFNISDGASVSAFTTGAGNANSITVNSPNFVNLGQNSRLTVETSDAGKAGNIIITTDTLNIGKDAELSATATETATNPQGGGSITLNASNLNISGKLGIFAETRGFSPAGTLTLQPNNNNPNLTIRFTDNGFISASTTAAGDGGNINLNATQTIDIRGQGRIAVTTSGSGNAGKIDITSQNINLADGLEITASTTSQGNAGNINLDAAKISLSQTQVNAFTDGAGNAGSISLSNRGNNANQVLLRDNSTISTEIKTNGQASQPSNIEISTNDLIINNSRITASTAGKGDAGSITVPNAQNITLNQSRITANTSGQGNTGLIDLNANENLNLNNSQINSSVEQGAVGDSQQITLNTPNLTLNNSQINATTAGQGNAGSISVEDSQIVRLDNSIISTEIQTTGIATQPSNITLNTRRLTLDNNSRITASTQGKGDAGSITVPNAQNITLNQSRITANTSGQGNTGLIDLNAHQNLNLNDSQINSSVEQGAVGDSQQITLNTPNLNLNNSQINATTAGQGNAGSILVKDSQIVRLDNSIISTEIQTTGIATQPSNITLNTRRLTLDNNSRITASTQGKGDAGSITVPNAQNITLNQSEISASTSGEGDTGLIDLNAHQNLNLNDSQINSSVEQGAVGNSQQITLNTPNLTLNNSQINATTAGQGNAGSILVQDSQNVRLDNSIISTEIQTTGIATQPSNITLNTRRLTLDNNSRITASTAGKGDAGSITVPNAQNITLNQSRITANTSGQGNTGLIDLNASENLNLNDSQINSSVEQGAVGNSQQITLNTPNLTLNNSQINATTAGQGNAGSILVQDSQNVRLDNSIISTEIQTTGIATQPSNITLNTRRLTLDNNSRITASTQGKGDSGSITVPNAQNISLNQSEISASTSGEGDTGLIDLNANENLNLNNSQINSSVEQGAVGNSQQITLNTPNLTLNNSQINATTAGQGNAGSILVQDSQIVRLNNSTISTEIQTTGIANQPSNITLNTRRLTLDNNSRITASTAGKGDAGSITVPNAQNISLNQSEISASTSGEGDTGLIDLNANENLNLNNSQINSSVEQGAVGDSQQITLNTPNLTLNNSQINATTAGQGNAGSILVQDSQNVRLDNSIISTEIQTTGIATQPSNITLNTRRLTLDNNSRITASTQGKGDAGSITVPNAQNITLNQSRITANTSGQGNTGLIDLNANQNLNLNDSQINSSVEQGAVGNSQQITLNTPNLTLNNSQINATTAGQGNAGSISVEDSQIVRLNNSTISTEIQTTGIANQPSNITLNTRRLTLDNNSRITASTQGKGDAGSITVPNAQNISLNQSEISASTSGEGDTGLIDLNANENLNLNNSQINSSVEQGAVGNSQQITLNTPNLNLNNSQINATTAGQGNAGSISVEDSQIVRLNNSTISTEIQTTGIATQPSNITLNTRRLTLENSQITASTSGQGDAGKITVNADTVTLNNQSQIATNTASQSNAGDILLNLTDNLNLNNSSIAASTDPNSTGKGGNITVNAPNFINLNQRATIQVNSQGKGDGGDIFLTTKNLRLDNNSTISAITASGEGGNITLNVTDRIIQRNNSPISATAGGTGNGGNITINTNFIFGRQNSGITANAFEGKGGNINITAQNLFLDRGSEVSASSQLGIDGVIDLNTPEIDPSRGLLDLPQNIIDPNSLISKNACRQGNQSEFTVTGRGGLPSSPEQVRTSDEVSVGLIEMTNQEANIINPTSTTTRKIIPAQGWQKNAKGEIILVAYPTANTAGRQSNSPVTCSPN